MRPLAHTIPLDEARRLLAEAARGVERVETVALAALGGRVMAEDVVAAGDVPPFTRAMMDGYAVRAEDTAGASREQPRTLAIVGTVFTGEVLSRAIGAGECAEVATGAPLPVGATAVVMVEDTAPVDDAHVQVRAAVRGDQHVGRAGTDIARGSLVLRAGDVLLPARVGAIAASGRAAVTVWAQPRVAIVSTGNEVVAPGQPLGPGQIHDVNRHTLSAIVEAHGGVAVPLDVASDTLDALGAAVDRAVACDLVVFSGGSSVGNRDLVMDILRGRGRVVFHGIATRPGKPTAFGTIDGVPVFGMPGNPTSCLTNAYVLLVPFLRTLAHLPAHVPRVVTAPLTRRVASSAGRHQFYTVRLVNGQAEPAFKASGDITSMAHADGYIEIPDDVAVLDAGTSVDVVLF
ncbi:MAG: molybdenum cofactor biosynthesis protein [Acidobacteria bacterium]|nr:molybdenum cofactor biosynthesis protein [Acidobacteriota bacterium]